MARRSGGPRIWRWGCGGFALLGAAAAAAWLATGGFASAVSAARAVGSRRHRTAPSVRRAPLIDHLRPTPAFGPPPPPATDAGARVLALLERVEANTRVTRYQHRTQVREAAGEYRWDCSGMAAWVLRRAAPRARRTLGRGRPVARRFARVIERAPTERPRRGWQRVDHIGAVRPGDLFAWERPPDFPSRNSGHVGFVVNRPVRLSGDRWAVRILDSTSLPHQSDTRITGGGGGTGRGTMTFVTDGAGHATAYGWHGTRSLGHIETPIRFGRVHR